MYKIELILKKGEMAFVTNEIHIVKKKNVNNRRKSTSTIISSKMSARFCKSKKSLANIHPLVEEIPGINK